jgi:hypothetical protein
MSKLNSSAFIVSNLVKLLCSSSALENWLFITVTLESKYAPKRIINIIILYTLAVRPFSILGVVSLSILILSLPSDLLVDATDDVDDMLFESKKSTFFLYYRPTVPSFFLVSKA